MNQISDLTQHIILARRSTPSGVQDAIRGVLDAAWRDVRADDHAGARTAMAGLVGRHQARMAADPDLLAETVGLLAASHGFLAIGRLLRAITGRRVVVILTPPLGEGADRPQPRIGGVDRVYVTPACLADPARALAWGADLWRRCTGS